MSKLSYKENQERLEDAVVYYKGYAIASKNSVCGGHGCYYSELQITPEGGYGTGELPPIFPTEEEAEAYIKKKDLWSAIVTSIRIVL